MNDPTLILIAVLLGFYLLILVMTTLREFAAPEPPEDAPDSNQDIAALDAETDSAETLAPRDANVPVARAADLDTVADAVAAESVGTETANPPPSAVAPPTGATDLAPSAEPIVETVAATDLSTEPALEKNPVPAAESAVGLTGTEPEAQGSDDESLEPEGADEETILSGEPLYFPTKGSPKFHLDYRGRLWIEKKNKGFFRQLRRPQVPPDEPASGSE